MSGTPWSPLSMSGRKVWSPGAEGGAFPARPAGLSHFYGPTRRRNGLAESRFRDVASQGADQRAGTERVPAERRCAGDGVPRPGEFVQEVGVGQSRPGRDLVESRGNGLSGLPFQAMRRQSAGRNAFSHRQSRTRQGPFLPDARHRIGRSDFRRSVDPSGQPAGAEIRRQGQNPGLQLSQGLCRRGFPVCGLFREQGRDRRYPVEMADQVGHDDFIPA